jgi:hypothetical protein
MVKHLLRETIFRILSHVLIHYFIYMFNRQAIGNITVWGALILAWVFFTTVYFLLSIGYPLVIGKTQSAALANAQQQGYNVAVSQAMQTFSGNVFQNGYGKAVLDLATALQAQVEGGCKEAVPVTIGSGSLGIINVACISQAQSTETQTPAAQ